MPDPITTLPPRPARRTQAERRDESGRGLIEAAIAVVAREGVAAATYEAIGREAGYSRGLAAQRFGSKGGLIEVVIGHIHDLREARVREAGVDDLPGRAAVLAYVELYIRDLAASDDYFKAYFKLLSSSVADATPLLSPFRDEHDRIRGRLGALLQRGQAEGEIRAELDADAAALMTGSLLLGLSMQALIDPAMDLAPIRDTVLATLGLGLRSPGAPHTQGSRP